MFNFYSIPTLHRTQSEPACDQSVEWKTQQCAYKMMSGLGAASKRRFERQLNETKRKEELNWKRITSDAQKLFVAILENMNARRIQTFHHS